ncbi:MAG: amino acid--tRNA ligase-related protein [Flammeovirgaceae bacterium]
MQYDITCNGYEISSGGVRNNSPEAILKGFEVVGYTEAEVRAKFGHMLEAYEFGAPYHAGFAPGVDRIMMILTGEDNIREVIPFPKNGSGIDPMTNSPSEVSPKQLAELGIKID